MFSVSFSFIFITCIRRSRYSVGAAFLYKHYRWFGFAVLSRFYFRFPFQLCAPITAARRTKFRFTQFCPTRVSRSTGRDNDLAGMPTKSLLRCAGAPPPSSCAMVACAATGDEPSGLSQRTKRSFGRRTATRNQTRI